TCLLLSRDSKSIVSSNENLGLRANVLTPQNIIDLWIVFTIKILTFGLNLGSLEMLVFSQMLRGWICVITSNRCLKFPSPGSIIESRLCENFSCSMNSKLVDRKCIGQVGDNVI